MNIIFKMYVLFLCNKIDYTDAFMIKKKYCNQLN